MNNVLIITLIIVAVAMAILAVLYIVGNKLQKKQMVQKEQLEAAAQQMSMLIIDKKYIKLKDANLPKMVLEQTPKRFGGAKMPIVKAKVGPQIMNLICDESIFADLPTKGEVKAMVSGIYITSVKSIRGKKQQNQEPQKKKGFRAKMQAKQKQFQTMYKEEEKTKAEKKASKSLEKEKKEKVKKITK